MRPQKRRQDDFLDMHTCDVISVFFWVAESISAIFKWFQVSVAAQSRVEATEGRQNCHFRNIA